MHDRAGPGTWSPVTPVLNAGLHFSWRSPHSACWAPWPGRSSQTVPGAEDWPHPAQFLRRLFSHTRCGQCPGPLVPRLDSCQIPGTRKAATSSAELSRGHSWGQLSKEEPDHLQTCSLPSRVPPRVAVAKVTREDLGFTLGRLLSRERQPAQNPAAALRDCRAARRGSSAEPRKDILKVFSAWADFHCYDT